MNSVLRALVIYLVLLLLFRIAGKRSLAQITTFDLVLTLIISEAIQQALVDSDNSLTHALLLVVTLIGMDVLLGVLKQKSEWVNRMVDGRPLVLIDGGRLRKYWMASERVSEEDILHAAREKHGLERLDQIKHAVLEDSGGISVVPKEDEK